MAIANPENYLTQASADARYQALGSLGSATPAQVDAGDTGTAGVSSSAARQDHEHPVAITSAQLVPAATIAAWASWTPTWTNLTVGNGVVLAKYVQLGKTVHFRLKLTFGTTSSISGLPDFTLPVAAAADYTGEWTIGHGSLLDTGTKAWIGAPQIKISDPSRAYVRYDLGDGGWGNPGATTPFTWVSTDVMIVGGTYEAA